MAKHALLIGIQDYPHLRGQDLAGPRNDIIEIGNLLLDRFFFPDDHVSAHFEGRINRDTVLNAFKGLEQRVERDDIVVVCYSGHGSRTRRGDQRIESLVPSDSGRPDPKGDGGDNRDIYDLEINDFIQRLNQKTPHLTLIFDCCHSGSVTRDPFVDTVREAPEDTRDRRSMSRDGGPEALSDDALAERAARLTESSARLLQDRRRALVLAACRAEEKAKEYRVSLSGDTYTHGIFSYFLSLALKDAPKGMTWRGIFESIAPRITALFPSQHPQIEGPAWNSTLFGTDEYRPRSYLRVGKPTDDRVGKPTDDRVGKPTDGRVVLAGGAAHGVSVGSVWTLHSATAQDPESEPQIAELEVESVAAGQSMARLVDQPSAPLTEGQRAFLRRMTIPEPLLRVAIQSDAHPELDEARLKRGLERSSLIALTDETAADVQIYGLAPRSTVAPEAPCSALGPLDVPTWAAVAKDGSAPVRARTAKGGAVSSLVRGLERVARYRGLLSVDNPSATNPLQGKVEMSIQRYQDGNSSRSNPNPATA